jgi:hypothetical protein
MADETIPTEPQPDNGEQEPTSPAPDNGDSDTPDEASSEQPAEVSVPELPEDTQAADEQALRDLHAELDALAQPLTDARDWDRLQAVRERQGAIVGEIERRREQAIRDAERAKELSEAPALPEKEPVLANVATARAARTRQPDGQQESPSQERQRPRVAAVAGDASAHRGQPFDYERAGIEAMEVARDNTMVGKARLASIGGFSSIDGAPEALSSDNPARRNDALIDEAVDSWAARRRVERAIAAGLTPSAEDVRVAAICEPFDILRDVPDDFNAMEVVSKIWPQRPIGRLAFQFTPGVGLSDVEDGVGRWTEFDQAAVDPDDSSTWKQCVEVDCPTPEDVTAEAVTGCITWPNTTEMSNPERVRNFQNAVNALRARVKEGRQLEIVDSLSHPYSYSGTYGALPTFVAALNSLIPVLNYVNRENPFGYTAILPPGLLQVLGIDRANRAFGHEQDPASVLAQLQADVEGIDRFVVALDHTTAIGGEPGPDGLTSALPAVGGSTEAIKEISDVYRVRLVDPSAAIYGETGELYAGVQRDANLIRQNRAQWFAEEYFLLAKHGVQPWAYIDVSLCADGSRAGNVDPDDYPCGNAS